MEALRAVVAIDGPAASGKSSVARRVAERLGWVYVNSGSFYRAATWSLLAAGVPVEDAAAVSQWMRDATLGVAEERGRIYLKINGKDVGAHLHEERVNRNVSQVSQVPLVRERITTLLREFAGHGGVVMEGRDIGSAVFPMSANKFYIDASPEVRARRRAMQGQADDLALRDRLDAGRETAPLCVAEGAVIIDSSHLALEEVVERVVERVRSGSGVKP